VDQRFIDLFNSYTHGGMSRRVFLDRFTALAGSSAASALLPLLDYNYARAETVAESDPRIGTEMVEIPGVAGLKGYLVTPKTAGKHGGVIVIHENRGLNPHIKDVTRRIAIEGFTALGVDFLGPLGGTPDDSDKAGNLFATLKPEDALADARAAVAALKSRPDVNGKVGAVGFCWGGGIVNSLAVAEPTLDAGVAYYGRQPSADKVPAIKAALLLHYAGLDQGIDAGIPAYEAALKQAGKTYAIFVYPNTNHGFNNDTSKARYDKAAADLAWGRTIGFFKKYLA
jgi:carboxymethylenebutenolidase